MKGAKIKKPRKETKLDDKRKCSSLNIKSLQRHIFPLNYWYFLKKIHEFFFFCCGGRADNGVRALNTRCNMKAWSKQRWFYEESTQAGFDSAHLLRLDYVSFCNFRYLPLPPDEKKNGVRCVSVRASCFFLLKYRWLRSSAVSVLLASFYHNLDEYPPGGTRCLLGVSSFFSSTGV